MPSIGAPKRQPFWALVYTSLGGAFFGLFLIIVGLIFSAGGGSCSGALCAFLTGPLFFVVLLVVIAIVLAYPILYWYLFTYELAEHAITINSGILFRQYEGIDFSRIQVVDNERGPLLWLFGLTMVKIWTASADQLEFTIEGKETRSRPHPDTALILLHEDAEALRHYMQRVKPMAGGL